MRKKKVILDYAHFNDDELNTLAGRVLACLEGHAAFTQLPVELDVLEAQILDFREKWQIASGGGGALDSAIKNDAKNLLALSLKDIAFYVNKVANGSHSLLLGSGLQLEAERKARQVPAQITGAMLIDGKQKNQMEVKFDPQKSAELYEYEIADSLDEDGNPIWNENFQAGSSRNNVYAPTTEGVIYYLRVRARNKKGIGDWSDTYVLRAR